MSRYPDHIWNEKGNSSLLLLTIMTLVIFSAAIVIDVSLISITKHRVAAAVDAAALAGAGRLSDGEDEAREAANQLAQENGLNTWSVTIDAHDEKVIVSGMKEVNLFFAPFFGINIEEVSAEAEARVGVIKGGHGFVPFGVEKQDFQYGELYTLKRGGGEGTNGNYGALALGGTGASNYRKNLKYGYDGYLEIGMEVETEPGNMSGPTEDGVQYRIDQDRTKYKCQSYQTADSSCNRIMYIPIIDGFDEAHGRSTVTIVGFAAFYLEGVEGNGNNSTVTGRFIKMLTQGELEIDPNWNGFGLEGIKLVR